MNPSIILNFSSRDSGLRLYISTEREICKPHICAAEGVAETPNYSRIYGVFKTRAAKQRIQNSILNGGNSR